MTAAVRSKPAPPDLPASRRAVRQRLLPWFETNQRDLPWRRRRTPYRVWLSELMLHQTRVDQAIPYYHRFLKRFPSIKSLAEASLDDVLKQWEGLGYYARARNAHTTARYITTKLAGRFPDTYDGLKSLPGIGPYTAAAVASLAFNRDHAVVDGNVIRVLTRLMAYPHNAKSSQAKKEIQQWATDLLPRGRSALFNEAVMELGATVCTPRAPLCETCPMRRVCAAYLAGTPTAFPRTRPKKKVPHKIVGAGVVVNAQGQVLIAQRKAESMLGGLWEFPGGGIEPGESMQECIARELKEELGIETQVGDELMIVRHAYSHFTIALHVHWARIIEGRPRPIHCADHRWVSIPDLREFAYSRADLHVVEKLQASLPTIGKQVFATFQ